MISPLPSTLHLRYLLVHHINLHNPQIAVLRISSIHTSCLYITYKILFCLFSNILNCINNLYITKTALLSFFTIICLYPYLIFSTLWARSTNFFMYSYYPYVIYVFIIHNLILIYIYNIFGFNHYTSINIMKCN